MSNELTALYVALLDIVGPLRQRLDSPEGFEYLLYRYGWSVTLDDAAMVRIKQDLAIVAPLEAFATVATGIREKLAANPDADPSPDEVVSLAEAAAALVRALSDFRMSNLSGLSDPLSRAEFWESLAENVLDDLLEEYLRIYRPGFYLVLRVFGVIRIEMTVPAEPGRQPYTRVVFDWAQALDVTKDPLQALKHAYHWGDTTQPFAHQAALNSIESVVRALGAPTARVVPALATQPLIPPTADKAIADDVSALRVTLLRGDSILDKAYYRLGFEVLPAVRNGQPTPSGLMIRPILEGGTGKTLPLTDTLALTWNVAASLDNVIGFAMFPGEADLVGGAPSIGTSLTLATTGDDPWYLLGGPRSSRVEVVGFSAGVSLSGAVDDPEIKLRVACEGKNGQPGCRIVVALGSADSFVKDTTKQSGLNFTCSPEIVWSSKSGFSFNGKPTFDIVLPISVELGPITLTNATITFGEGSKTTSTSSMTMRVGVAVTGKLGPVTFVLDRIGFACTLVPYSRDDVKALPPGSDAPALGSLGVVLDFAPPEGVGLSVDASIVSGGGFIGHYGDEYAGALDLTIGDFAVKAYGVLQTKLPGGLPGYSFIVALSAEFSPSINLVFGFTLDGVGGMVGINRTMSPDVIEAALWGHRLDGLLFPKDPVATAPQLVTALDSYFPAAKGRYLFGPLAKIGWGNDIVTGEIALLIELPEPVRILLLGEIQLAVPKQKPQLEIHISFAGGLDFGKKLAFFDATIHDSRIETYPITGDLAFRYGWGDDGVFALAIGGFNPHFQAPAGFPALKPLSISISSSVAQLDARAYFALTANTLQFGARVEMTAGTGSFNVHGWLGFDALCERNPLSFIFDLTAGVELRHGTSVLASVHLDGHLSGPNPWHISGEASLSLFFFDVSVHFDKTWGESGIALPLPDPLGLVLAALADPTSFTGALAAGVAAVVSTIAAPVDAAAALLLDPASSLRVAQRVLPLGQPVTRFGGAALGRTVQLSMEGLTAFATTFDTAAPVTEEFAPAQFFDFSDSEKLSLPSFSRFAAGLEFGGDAVDVGSGARARADMTPLVYDTTIIDSPTVRRPGLPYKLADTLVMAMGRDSGGRGRGLGRYAPPIGARTRIDLQPDRWVIAGTSDLALRGDIGSDGSKMGAQVALRRFLAANPDQQGQLQIVLAEEAA